MELLKYRQLADGAWSITDFAALAQAELALQPQLAKLSMSGRRRRRSKVGPRLDDLAILRQATQAEPEMPCEINHRPIGSSPRGCVSFERSTRITTVQNQAGYSFGISNGIADARCRAL